MGGVQKPKRRLALRTRVADRIGRTKDDPLVPYLTAGGLVLTVIGVVGGLIIDAGELVGNVFANLVLLGPALVISNILVAYVRRARSHKRAEWHMAVIGVLLLPGVKVANDFLEMLGSETRCDVEGLIAGLFTRDGILDLHGLVASLDDAADNVEKATDQYLSDKGDDLEIWMPIKGEVLALPNMAAVQAVVATLDREIPCPDALLSAAAAEQFSRFGFIDFVFHGSGSMYGPPPGLASYVREPKIGFGEISAWMLRGMERADDHITVGIESYYSFVLECLSRSKNVIRDIIEVAPKGLIADAREQQGTANPTADQSG
jgi:hypothetical protein